jgi:hypothetical protein
VCLTAIVEAVRCVTDSTVSVGLTYQTGIAYSAGVMESTPAIEHLRIYRLRHDLTYSQLADQMTDAGYPMLMRNLHRILQNGLQVGPRDRTMFKIDQFVAYLQAAQRPTLRPRSTPTPTTTRKKAVRRAR